ncbi:MAG: hypothetical protein V2A73_10780, partial [Pseudomonadota bacterium]
MRRDANTCAGCGTGGAATRLALPVTAVTAVALVVTGAVAASGCGDSPVPEGPPFRAQLVVMTRYDPDTETGHFAFEVAELTRPLDLDSLASPVLVMRRGGVLSIEGTSGSVVSDGRLKGGTALGLRYRVDDDGVVVPRDYPTLAMLSAFRAFERILAVLPDVAGMSVEDYVGSGPPLELFFEPEIRILAEAGDTSLFMKHNAFFLVGQNQFALAQRSRLETIPLAVCESVIGHELGHALFEHLFASGEIECEPGSGMFPGRWLRESVL